MRLFPSIQCFLGLCVLIREALDQEAKCKVIDRNSQNLCPESYRQATKNNYPTCFSVYNRSVNVLDLVEWCDQNEGKIPDLRTKEERERPGRAILKAHKNKTIWIAPYNTQTTYSQLNPGKLGTYQCTAMNITKAFQQPCNETRWAACEALVKGEKPVVFVGGRGQPEQRILYEGAFVTLGCSVIRVRQTQITLFVNDTSSNTYVFTSSNNRNMSVFVDQTECGMKTIAYTPQDLDIRVSTVVCLVDGGSQANCQSASNENCVLEGPFQYSLGPVGPQILVKFHRPPNIVLSQEELVASCFSLEDSPSAIRWTIFEDDIVQVLEDGVGGVKVAVAHVESILVQTSVLKLDMQGRCWGGKQLEIACYGVKNVNIMVRCEDNNRDCSKATIYVENKPLVHVRGKAFKDTQRLYENSIVIITCSYNRLFEQEPAIYLSNSTDFSINFSGDDLHVETERLECGIETKVTLELFFNIHVNVAKQQFVICTIGDTHFFPCNRNNSGCGKIGPFDYMRAPKKVKISKQPNIVRDEIVATCTSFGFKTVWAITDLSMDNKKLIILKKDDVYVKIEETETSKDKWSSKLTMHTGRKGLTGKKLILGCYITEINEDEINCWDSNFWCDTFMIKPSSSSSGLVGFSLLLLIVFAGLAPILLSAILFMLPTL